MYFRKTFALIIAGTVLFFAGCKDKPAESEKKVIPEVAVQIAKAVQRDVTLTSEYTGKIVAVSQVDVVPRIRGFLEAIKYTDGSIVNKGDLLFTIQDFDYKIAVDKAKASFISAQANEVSARANYSSAVKANEKVKGTVSENDIIQYWSKWNQAKADYKKSLAQYQDAVKQLSYTKIYASFRGKISKALKTPGDLLDGTGPNPPVLCTLVRMDPIYVEFQISDRYFDHSFDQVNKKGGTGNPDNQNNNDSGAAAGEETPAAAVEEQTLPAVNPSADNPSGELIHQVAYTPDEEALSVPVEEPVSALPAATPVAAEAPAVPATELVAAESPTTADPTSVFPNIAPEVGVDPTKQKVQNVSSKSYIQDAEKMFEAIEKELSKPFIPQDEDMAPSAVLKDNTAYMKGDRKGKPIPFELTLSDDPNAMVYKGTLNYNANTIETSTGSMTIRGVVSNPEYRLYPGHICTVRLKSEVRKDVIVIEERAICVDLTSKYVWAVDNNNEAHKRYIVAKESFENGTLRIIEPYAETESFAPDGTKSIKVSGLKVGEAYLVEGMQNVREGSKTKAVAK